jgi:hypothetical protein
MIGHLEKFKNNVKKNKAVGGNTFQDALEKKKEDFNSLIMNKPPDKVDFSDKLDDSPIGSGNIESILAETIARRERELNIVLDTQNKNGINTLKTDTSSGNGNNIKIGNMLRKEDVLNVKQVRFSDKVEMKEHLYDDTDQEALTKVGGDIPNKVGGDIPNKVGGDINKVGGDITNIENASEIDNVLISKMNYKDLLEKIDVILKKSQRDVLDIVGEFLKSKQF